MLLSRGIDDETVLLGTEAGGGVCWRCPGGAKAEGMGLGKLLWDSFLCEGGDNLNVPALRKLEHSSAVSSWKTSALSALQAWKSCSVWGIQLGMLWGVSGLPGLVTTVPVLYVGNGALRCFTSKTHGRQYLIHSPRSLSPEERGEAGCLS